MAKFFKISLVALAVVAGVSVAQAGDVDGKADTVIDQVLADQMRSGN